MSVDGTNFRIEEPTEFDKTWYSHKFKKAAVKYEVGLDMKGNIAWINGPFRGSENDLAIFRRELLPRIPTGRLVIADKGYRGVDIVSVPNGLEEKEIQRFKSVILARHETINKRFKDFGILNQTFRHTRKRDPLKSHKPFFTAVAVITQFKINNGEQLFDVYVE